MQSVYFEKVNSRIKGCVKESFYENKRIPPKWIPGTNLYDV
jgi:hypothetical protein